MNINGVQLFSLVKVITHYLPDEEADYNSRPEEEKGSHIYNHLKKLEKLIHEKTTNIPGAEDPQ